MVTDPLPFGVPTWRCGNNCGRSLRLYGTYSPFEFTVKCPCGYEATVSWSHAAPPPDFEKVKTTVQLLGTLTTKIRDAT